MKAPLTSSMVPSLSWMAYIVIEAKITAHRARRTTMPYLSVRTRVASGVSAAGASFFSVIASHLPGARP